MPHPRSLALVLAVALLTGCASSTEKPVATDKSADKSGFRILPRVFKFPIQQGNVVTQDMVDKLQPGMTRSQVRFIMGTPLIADTFNQNRWDYLYTLKMPSGKQLREQMTILFDGDRLVGISGDYIPGGGAPAQAAQSTPATAQAKSETAKPEPEAAKTAPDGINPDDVVEVHGIGD